MNNPCTSFDAFFVYCSGATACAGDDARAIVDVAAVLAAVTTCSPSSRRSVTSAHVRVSSCGVVLLLSSCGPNTRGSRGIL